MKKIVFLFAIILYSSISYAVPMFGGGAVSLSTTKSGGYGEFGVTFFDNKYIELRNIISIGGYGKNSSSDYSAGYLDITEKITFGMSKSNIEHNFFVMPYGFIAGSFGFFSAQNTGFFDEPFSYEIYGGLGADIYGSKDYSLFIEAGGGIEMLTSAYAGSNILGSGFVKINIGFRGFF